MNSWNKVPKQDKEVLLNMGTQDEAFGTLKELGYPESLALKPIAFSEDGKLLVTVNLIRQFRIEYIKT